MSDQLAAKTDPVFDLFVKFLAPRVDYERGPNFQILSGQARERDPMVQVIPEGISIDGRTGKPSKPLTTPKVRRSSLATKDINPIHAKQAMDKVRAYAVALDSAMPTGLTADDAAAVRRLAIYYTEPAAYSIGEAGAAYVAQRVAGAVAALSVFKAG